MLKNNKEVIVSLSGGMDSATVLGFYSNQGYKVYPLFFNYGSKHNLYELRAAIKISEYYDTEFIRIVNLTFINELFKSNLLDKQGEIPEGHYKSDNMKLTVVPGRNSIFMSIMAGYAESIGVSKIAIGTHKGDHTIYPDCRDEFINAMSLAILYSSDKQVEVEAPIQNLDKTGILQIGYKFIRPVPYGLTRTCYKNQELSCGKCGSCTERLEAFKQLNITDPVLYEDEI